MDTIEQIKNHIAKGDTEKAIELLVQFTKETNSPKQDDAILLSGQYKQWKREIASAYNNPTANFAGSR